MDKSSKPILLYIITKSEIGGAQSHVLSLIETFQAQYEIHLATGCAGQLTETVDSLDIPVHIIPTLTRSIQLFGDFLCIKHCIDLIHKIKPEIIHAHSSKAGVIARVAGRICGVPTVYTAHGWGFSPGAPKIRRIVALLAEKVFALITTRIICVSESDRQLALHLGVGNSRLLTVVYNGLQNEIVPLADCSAFPVRLIMVARFNEQKDQATLLKAIAHLADPSIHLDLVGSGCSLAVCQALADSLGIAQQVSFLGDRRDVPALLAQSQIFILSTHYEGLPISILEAMQAGLPVIATDVNGIPEEVTPQVTGLLVPPGNVKALAEDIQVLVRSPELRQQMGKAGREKFEQEFTTRRMSTQIQSIYQQILKVQHTRVRNRTDHGISKL